MSGCDTVVSCLFGECCWCLDSKPVHKEVTATRPGSFIENLWDTAIFRIKLVVFSNFRVPLTEWDNDGTKRDTAMAVWICDG